MRAANHVGYGRQGEEQAREYLQKKGYTILESNFSTRIGELDLIATYNDLLIIIEVKRRKKILHGYPREAVTLHKQRQIVRLTQWYVQKNDLHHMQIRFDVIEVLDDAIEHIENAFYAW